MNLIYFKIIHVSKIYNYIKLLVCRRLHLKHSEYPREEGEGLVLLQQLPQDILFDIFARLPLKPLIKFKTVCKFWFNIISDPHFIDFHLQQWISKLKIFSSNGDFQFYSFNLKEMSIKPIKQPNKQAISRFGFRKRYSIPEVATCDGLILLMDVLQEQLYVYNSIRPNRLKLLPPVPNLNPSYFDNYSLVHDASIKKYKILVCSIFSFCRCNILTIGAKNAAWRVIRQPPLEMVHCYTDHAVAVNGVLHWIAETSRHNININEEERVVYIQTFDIAREMFEKIIELPIQPIRFMGCGPPLNLTLLAIKGSLCLMSLVSKRVSKREDELDIWVLKGSTKGWILQHKITLSSMLCKPLSLKSLVKEAFHPVFVMESCSSCLTYIIVRHYDGLFCFNLETHEIRQISIENQNSFPTIAGRPGDR